MLVRIAAAHLACGGAGWRAEAGRLEAAAGPYTAEGRHWARVADEPQPVAPYPPAVRPGDGGLIEDELAARPGGGPVVEQLRAVRPPLLAGAVVIGPAVGSMTYPEPEGVPCPRPSPR